MAPFLTKILMETGQEVPSFFESFKPTDGELNFDEDEDNAIFEADAGADGANDAWGAGDNTPAVNADAGLGGENGAVGWGQTAPASASASAPAW